MLIEYDLIISQLFSRLPPRMRAAGILLVSVCCVIATNGAVVPSAPQRIAGGAFTSINQYPFSTALITTLGTGSVYLQACGGSILTTNAVLSAASCFHTDGEPHPVHWWRARVGSTFANAGGFTHMVRLITAHPDYISTVGDNDIAVLRTTIPFTYAEELVRPASIAGAVLTLNTNQPVSAIGWGLPSGTATESSPELRQVQYWVVNHETCRNRYNTVGFTVTDNMLCSGWLDVGVRGQCQGDTGSPLLNADGVVVGVYSWTSGECAEGWFPDVNTMVSLYTRWIVEAAYA